MEKNSACISSVPNTECSGMVNTMEHSGKQPLVSVIIPVYNVSLYLRQCLDSVVAQTYRNLEIIIVDDGLRDDSGSICDQYAESGRCLNDKIDIKIS